MLILLAYIDPATGSLALQATIGVILSGLFLLKMYWKKLRTAAARWFERKA